MSLALLLAFAAHAQSTYEPWRTVETEHYRVHYPAAWEPWALDAAQRFEAIRERVSAEVGYAPTEVIDVVVMDPFRSANGFALPFLGAPRMGVFPTAPEASSGIANYRLWAEDLVVHEDAHLVHLLRPSRSPFGRLVQNLTGTAPISTKSPAWVIEGYATVVEGRLTSFGRPNSASRASFLRGLAQEGKLPTYGELNGSGRWQAGSFRYLVGSAFLEWLDAEHSPHPDDPGQSFRDLWARLTARKQRSFADAFRGVYGEAPDVLYGRFSAETVADALAVEEARPPDPAALWLDMHHGTGAPTVNADGTRIALVQSFEDAPPRLVIYDTAFPEEAEEKWEKAVAKVKARDPEDVPGVRPKVWGRTPVQTRPFRGRVPSGPRFREDGTIVFTSWERNAAGDRVPDLFVWDPKTDEESRLTRNASIRDADPHGDAAVAVWSEGGSSALVSVSLVSGDTTPITDVSPLVVYDVPRVSPDGSRVAVLRNEGRWSVVTLPIAGGEAELVPLPTEDAEPYGLDWTRDGKALLVSLGSGGFVEVWRRDLATGAWSQVTHSRAGAYAPAVTPAGILFYLSPDARGLDVYRLPASAWGEGVEERLPVEVRTGVLPPERPVAQPIVEVRPAEAGPYGFGPQQPRALAAAQASAAGTQGEVGLYVGDPIGRTEIVALGGLGWIPGGSLALTWRGLPVRTTLTGFALDDGAWRGGGELDLGWRTYTSRVRFDLEAGGWADTTFDEKQLREAGRGAARFAPVFWIGNVRVISSLAASGQLGLDDWRLGEAHAALSVKMGGWTVEGGVSGWDSAGVQLQLGGLRPSILPDGPAAQHIWVPWLDEEPVDSAFRARAGATAGDVGTVFAERFDSPDGDWTFVGVDAAFGSDAQPLGRVPGISAQAGFGCIVAGEGVTGGRCDELEEWRGWIGIRWVPGAPVGMP